MKGTQKYIYAPSLLIGCIIRRSLNEISIYLANISYGASYSNSKNYLGRGVYYNNFNFCNCKFGINNCVS